MKKSTLDLLHKSLHAESGPISSIVSGMELKRNETPSCKRLEEELEAAGYEIEFETGKNGSWARVFLPAPADGLDKVMKAQGYSTDGAEDALLHAVYGAVREEKAAFAVQATLTKADVQVDDSLRQKLESRYILEGGQSRLDADVSQMVALKK